MFLLASDDVSSSLEDCIIATSVIMQVVRQEPDRASSPENDAGVQIEVMFDVNSATDSTNEREDTAIDLTDGALTICVRDDDDFLPNTDSVNTFLTHSSSQPTIILSAEAWEDLPVTGTKKDDVLGDLDMDLNMEAEELMDLALCETVKELRMIVSEIDQVMTMTSSTTSTTTSLKTTIFQDGGSVVLFDESSDKGQNIVNSV